MHSALPLTSLYLPGAQASQSPPSGPLYPALQTQLASASLEAAKCECGGKLAHAASPTAPLYVPASHAAHGPPSSPLYPRWTRGPGLPRLGCDPGSGGFEMVKIDSCPDSVHSKMNKAGKKKATKNEAEKPVVAACSASAASEGRRVVTVVRRQSTDTPKSKVHRHYSYCRTLRSHRALIQSWTMVNNKVSLFALVVSLLVSVTRATTSASTSDYQYENRSISGADVGFTVVGIICEFYVCFELCMWNDPKHYSAPIVFKKNRWILSLLVLCADVGFQVGKMFPGPVYNCDSWGCRKVTHVCVLTLASCLFSLHEVIMVHYMVKDQGSKVPVLVKIIQYLVNLVFVLYEAAIQKPTGAGTNTLIVFAALAEILLIFLEILLFWKAGCGQGTFHFNNGQRHQWSAFVFTGGRFEQVRAWTSKNEESWQEAWTGNGHGTRTWPDGSRYTGVWQGGKRHGQGTFTFGHGYGGDIYSEGDRYIGEWREDQQHGQGTFTSKRGRWSFTGTLEKWRPVSGVLTDADGRRFDVKYAADCGVICHPTPPTPSSKVDIQEEPSERRQQHQCAFGVWQCAFGVWGSGEVTEVVTELPSGNV